MIDRDQEQKQDAGKPQTELLDPYALGELAKVLTFGATKYEANGWRKGIAWMRTVGAILRHTFKFMAGETYDEETGLHHMAHVMCNAMFLVNWSVTHPELDDRPTSEEMCQPSKDYHVWATGPKRGDFLCQCGTQRLDQTGHFDEK